MVARGSSSSRGEARLSQGNRTPVREGEGGVLELVGVVEDVVARAKVAQLLGAAQRARLDLEVADELVLDAEACGGDRVAPHLLQRAWRRCLRGGGGGGRGGRGGGRGRAAGLHPALDDLLGLAVGAQVERPVEPPLGDALQLLAVDEQRARPHGVESLGGAFLPVLLDDLRRTRRRARPGEPPREPQRGKQPPCSSPSLGADHGLGVRSPGSGWRTCSRR